MKSLLPVRKAFGIPLAPTLVALMCEAMSALAQGALAISLGALARFLGGAGKGAQQVAGMTWMSRVLSLAPSALTESSATGVAVVGLLAVAIGAGARILLETRETREAADLAARARLSVLSSALRGESRSIGLAITVPHEIELGARAERSRLRAIVHLSILALVIVALDVKLAAIVLLILAPFAVLLRPIRRAIKATHLAATQGAIDTVDACRDVLEHAAVWATCGGASLAMSRVEALSREGTSLSSRAARARVAASASNELLAALAIVVLVAVFAPARVTLLPVLIALISTYRPIRELAEASAIVERGRRAAESCPPREELIDDERAWPRGAFVIRGLRTDVGNDVAIDLELKPGRIAAIVGAPGSGKSALLEAIVGVRPMQGALSIGGARFDSARVGERPIAWVPPSPPVLPATLEQNLDPANKGTRAKDLLEELGGVPARSEILRRVSSGEAQRIALARALASDAPILLLDEPTANLDAESERRAIESIQRELRDRCAVIVTHRPAPLAIADEVINLGERTVRAPESQRRIA